MGNWLNGLKSPPIVKVLFSSEDPSEVEKSEKQLIHGLSIGGRLLNVMHVAKLVPVNQKNFSGIGERVFARRKALGLSQSDVSRLTGIAQAAISFLEGEHRSQMLSDDVVRLAKVLNTTVEFLVTGESS
jgi:DNA-binding XRE family transcriptional regulator